MSLYLSDTIIYLYSTHLLIRVFALVAELTAILLKLCTRGEECEVFIYEASKFLE